MSLISNKAERFLEENPNLTLEGIDDLEVSRKIGKEVEKLSPQELGEVAYEVGNLPPYRWEETGSEVLFGIAEHVLKRELERLLTA